MEERWQDAMKALGRRHAPTPAETERFVSAVMRRLEPRPSPWRAALDGVLQARWLAPALAVGLATVFLAIGRQADSPDLDLELLAGATPAVTAPLIAPEAP